MWLISNLSVIHNLLFWLHIHEVKHSASLPSIDEAVQNYDEYFIYFIQQSFSIQKSVIDNYTEYLHSYLYVYCVLIHVKFFLTPS